MTEQTYYILTIHSDEHVPGNRAIKQVLIIRTLVPVIKDLVSV